jgi:hypothetical protein
MIERGLTDERICLWELSIGFDRPEALWYRDTRCARVSNRSEGLPVSTSKYCGRKRVEDDHATVLAIDDGL